jgi:hypothetical protein
MKIKITNGDSDEEKKIATLSNDQTTQKMCSNNKSPQNQVS